MAVDAMENPYWLSVVEPRAEYWSRIGASCAGFALLFASVDRLVSSEALRGVLPEALSSPRQSPAAGRRPRSGLNAATTACSFVHSCVTSVSAVCTVALLWAGEDDAFAVALWQWALAFSQGYFLADAFLYGARRESWVVVHHLWMVVAHHPIGEPRRLCQLMGCGDCRLAVWLSATGYWAELSTVFLCVRWLMLHTLTRHNVWYSINSVCLLVTYPVTRLGGAAAILAGSLWPRWEQYSRHGLGGLVTFTTVTYIAMALMSAYYYCTLVSRGFSRAITFSAAPAKEQ